MPFTEQEKQIILYGKQQGKARSEVEEAVLRYRLGMPKSEAETEQIPTIKKIGSVTLGAGKGLIESGIETTSLIQGLGQRILALVDPTKTLEQIREETGIKSLTDEDVREMLRAKNEYEKTGKVLAFGGEILAGGGASLLKTGITKGGRFLVKKTAPLLERGAEKITPAVEKITEKAAEITPGIKGLIQETKEFAERVPRFIGRAKETAVKAGERAEKISISEPSIQTAIKSGLDERVISTVQAADQSTLKAYKEMVDIAQETKGGTLRVKQRPEIVAGRAAEEQFKLIEKEKKAIGSQIGKEVDKLSKTTKVPMQPSLSILDDVLEQQGIIKTVTDKGKTILDFSGTRFTPAERNRIKELYKLASEGGEELTPRQIRDKDQLFSKLQREARFEGVGDILIDTEQGQMSLFRVFRDVYSNTLEDIAPNIRDLNRKYRNIYTLQDDIENSIIKSGKFETTKGVSEAEFAQTNLRRLMSDAQSAADYREIAREMEKVARELGYKGANTEDLIAFATELRKIYPETIPPTSFTGGTRTGITGKLDILAGKILESGAPNITDQQKALKEMIETLIE